MNSFCFGLICYCIQIHVLQLPLKSCNKYNLEFSVVLFVKVKPYLEFEYLEVLSWFLHSQVNNFK